MSVADPTAAARMRRYRQRQKEEADRNARNVTPIEELQQVVKGLSDRIVTLGQQVQRLTETVSLRQDPPKKDPPDPLKESPPISTKKTSPLRGEAKERRGERLPADFEVPAEWIEDGQTEREHYALPVIDLGLEATKFCRFWTAKSGRDATKIDWRKTWLNWCTNARGSGGGGNGQWHKKPTPVDNLFAAFAAAAEDRDRGAGGAFDETLLDRR
jgi:hypothetical protein